MKHGYSGDKLEVVLRGNSLYVRKHFGDKNRARESIFKQNSFERIASGRYQLLAVPILGFFETECQISIDMPYISGEVGSDLTLSGYIDVPRALQKLLGMYISANLDKSQTKVMNADPGLKKIEEIKNRVDDKWNKYLDKGRSYFMKYISGQDAFYPRGTCHGDLTLSNIMYENGSFFLIDFIPSTYESILTDIAKIEQDFTYGWSSRYREKVLAADIMLFSKSATPEVINLVKTNNKVSSKAITILNWLRITPYIVDLTTDRLVTKVLDEIFSQID